MKITKQLQHLEGLKDGTYLVMTRDQRWGNGITLAEALKHAKDAGARSLLAKNVIVLWQPDAAWITLKIDVTYENRRPTVDDYGRACFYGERSTLKTLHGPSDTYYAN